MGRLKRIAGVTTAGQQPLNTESTKCKYVQRRQLWVLLMDVKNLISPFEKISPGETIRKIELDISIRRDPGNKGTATRQLFTHCELPFHDCRHTKDLSKDLTG